MKKLSTSSSVLCLAFWLLMMATSALSQILNPPAVIDTNLRPVLRGIQYYIQPFGILNITTGGGRFTLTKRNNTCPLFVGQENTNEEPGLPVVLTPYAAAGDDDIVRMGRDFRAAFVATTFWNGSTEWRLDDADTTTRRRLIATGSTNGTVGDYRNYFRTEALALLPGYYYIRWCPRTVCSTCQLNCGTFGQLVQNGTFLMAMDGTPQAYQFVRA